MEDSISILIIEDDQVWIHTLEIILKELGFSVVQSVSTADDALAAFGSFSYDVILLDISLHGKKSGLELGKVINRLYHKPFIFVTAGNDHDMKDMAEANPSAYLKKPVDPSSLYIAINNAINNFERHDNIRPDKDELSSFFVKEGTRYKKIDWKDIAYLSAGKNYISLFNIADGKEYYIRSSLQKTLQHIIPKHLQRNFVQVNRSEVVQISYISEMANDQVVLNDKTFSVSELFNKELKSRLNIV